MPTAARPGLDRTALSAIATLGSLLDRLEASSRPVDPAQYRAVAERLVSQLRAVTPDAALRAVLAGSPAAAELYENLQYAHAGLCLRPLDTALSAEQRARALIERARITPADGAA